MKLVYIQCTKFCRHTSLKKQGVYAYSRFYLPQTSERTNQKNIWRHCLDVELTVHNHHLTLIYVYDFTILYQGYLFPIEIDEVFLGHPLYWYLIFKGQESEAWKVYLLKLLLRSPHTLLQNIRFAFKN